MIFQVGGTRECPVTIGAYEYQLLFREHVVHRGDALYGIHDPESIEMQVDSTQPMQRQVVSTLHEAIHAMSNQSHTELEEETVRMLAMQFMGFMRTNPKLIAAMMAALK